MSPSPYSSENDSITTPPHFCALSDSMDLDELLPIEQEELGKSSDSLSFYPYGHAATSYKKYVCFGGIESVHYIESCKEMSDAEVGDRWFLRDELSDFKRSARTVCKEHHNGRPIGPDDSARGMDVYYPSRQRANAKYIYHVVHASRDQCSGNPEYLSQLCEKWSTKARERSQMAGIQDFYDAYHPDMSDLNIQLLHQPPQGTAQQHFHSDKVAMPSLVVQRPTVRPSSADLGLQRTR